MSVKICLIGARLSKNLGGPSLYVATKKLLDEHFSDVQITYLAFYKTFADDLQIAEKYPQLHVVKYKTKPWLLPMAWMKKIFGFMVGPDDQKQIINAIKNSDMLIDIWGISFADSLGTNSFLKRFTDGLHFYIAKLFNKPVIKYTAAMGPFQQKWNRYFGRYYLNKCVDVILARDEITKKAIAELGVKTPVYQSPDTAFLLPVSESDLSERYQNIRSSKPLVCLSVSYQAKNRAQSEDHYFNTMAQFVRQLIHIYNAHVVILPNEVSAGVLDDTRIAEEIKERADDVNCSVAHIGSYTAQEIKGIIKLADAVVAARYHTIVAALSLGIPTLAIGWHHKYAALLSLFEQQKQLCNIENLSIEDLQKKFEKLWRDRQQIRETIEKNLVDVKNEIHNAADQVFGFVEKKLEIDN